MEVPVPRAKETYFIGQVGAMRAKDEPGLAFRRVRGGGKRVRRLLFAFTDAAFAAGWSSVSPSAEPLEVASVTKRAALAAEFILQMQLPSGFFEYEYDFLRGSFTSDNNIVRQAGAAAVLAEYASFSGDAAVAESAGAAVGALSAVSVSYGYGAVVSMTGLREDAATGATALSLLAELHFFQATGDSRFENSRGRWLRALEQLQLPNGGFARAPDNALESAYYNGEAWLALAQYSRMFPGDRMVAAILGKADSYLIARYGAEADPRFVHWGLMAAVSHDRREPVPRLCRSDERGVSQPSPTRFRSGAESLFGRGGPRSRCTSALGGWPKYSLDQADPGSDRARAIEQPGTADNAGAAPHSFWRKALPGRCKPRRNGGGILKRAFRSQRPHRYDSALPLSDDEIRGAQALTSRSAPPGPPLSGSQRRSQSRRLRPASAACGAHPHRLA
jgi:hypothetical protein